MQSPVRAGPHGRSRHPLRLERTVHVPPFYSFVAAPLLFEAPQPIRPEEIADAGRRVRLRRAIRRTMVRRAVDPALLASVTAMPLDALRAVARLLVGAPQ